MKKFRIEPKREPISKTLRLDEAKWEELEALASKNNMSVNYLITKMIDYALENMEQTKK